MHTPRKHVGIFTATRWELQALRLAMRESGARMDDEGRTGGARWIRYLQGSGHLTLVQTGVGPAKAEQVSRRFLTDQPCDLIISAGFVCALTPSSIGDLLIGTEAFRMASTDASAAKSALCDSAYHATALGVAKEMGLTARSGRIVTVEQVLGLARDKHQAAASTAAIGLDMESAALGAIERFSTDGRPVPFLVIRAVSDLVDEDLPVDFNLFLRSGGWAAGIVSLMGSPSLAGLWRLRSQASLAGRQLTMFFARFLRVLC
jgi:adenosylhomocysteine nucleosidase